MIVKYGYVKSELDGSEHKFGAECTMELPEKYSYEDYLPNVMNQGNAPICVTCSCAAVVNWRMNLKTSSNKTDNKVKIYDIYNIRENKNAEGMSFKEALHYLRHHGVETANGLHKINEYAMVGSEMMLKYALVMNGPCIGGLIVRSDRNDFWNGNGFYGGHAICIVGYDKNGFIIRNSWGKSYGHNGYYTVKYEDFNKFVEIWTIL